MLQSLVKKGTNTQKTIEEQIAFMEKLIAADVPGLMEKTGSVAIDGRIVVSTSSISTQTEVQHAMRTREEQIIGETRSLTSKVMAGGKSRSRTLC